MNATSSEASPGKTKAQRFSQVFWLTFLVVSLAYAWYSFYAPSNDIVWAEDYEAAQELAVQEDKPILLFFTGKWCSPCQIMKRQVFADEEVAKNVNASFIPVTIDVDAAESAAALTRYQIGVTPTTILTDSRGVVLQRKAGGMSKDAFLGMLGQLDAPAHEAMK
ncbi:MAG: thioredoxin family protein [Planctomycetota bacterium]